MRAKRPQDRDPPDKHPRPNFWINDFKKLQKADARWQKRFLDRQYHKELHGSTIVDNGVEDDFSRFDRGIKAFERTRVKHNFFSGPPPKDFNQIDLTRQILMHSTCAPVVTRTVGGLCVDHRNFARVVRRPQQVVLPHTKVLCEEIAM